MPPAHEPGDLGKRVFGPLACISATDDARAACAKNNVSLAGLFEPFGHVFPRAQLRDGNNQPYVLEDIHVHFADIHRLEKLSDHDFQQELAKVIARIPAKPVSELLAEAVVVRDRSDIEAYLLQGDPTPWFDVYRTEFFRLLRGINVVSTQHADPVAALAQLYDARRPPPPLHEPWANSDILQAYVVLHDASAPGIPHDHGDRILEQMKRTFPPNACFLLKINSRTQDTPEHDWCPPNFFSHPLSEPAPQATLGVPTGMSPNVSLTSLNMSVNASGDSLTTHSPQMPRAVPPAAQAPPVETGSMLTMGDLESVRDLVQAFASGCLVPYMDRVLRDLSDQLAQMRRGMARSFFSSSKKWFGAASAGAQSEKGGMKSTGFTIHGYSHEGIEAQSRRLADFAFMLGDYELAAQTYQAIRREYQHDKAWKYMAGAQEMAGLSMYYVEPFRRDADPYLEQASATYLQRCNSQLLSERAGLLAADIFMARDQYRDATATYIRMTGEDSDLRSALLLEQSAHCFLHLRPSMYRKYAFHLILAGHRYGKANQRRYALRCYYQSLQVYQGKDWSLAEDHIHFTIGRQCFYLGDISAALQSFAALLRPGKVPSSQESSYLKEYLYTLKQSLSLVSDHRSLPALPLPRILDDTIRVTIFEQAATQLPAKDWMRMEKVISERYATDADKRRWDFPVFKSTPSVYDNTTDNTASPCVFMNEPVTVEFALRNDLTVPINLNDVALTCVFEPASGEQSGHAGYEVGRVDKVAIDGGDTLTMSLKVRPLAVGKLKVTGIEYSISNVVRGSQPFKLQGKRLNNTKQQRMHATYAADNRLELDVRPSMPLLSVHCAPLPQSMVAGETCELLLELSNIGGQGLSELCAVTTHPVTLTFGYDQAKMFGPDGREVAFGSQPRGSRAVVFSNAGLDKGIFDLLENQATLPPGHVLRLPIWYRSEILGPQQLNVLFGYQGEPGPDARTRRDNQYRFARLGLDTTMLPSLRVSAFVQPSQTEVADLLMAVEIENLQAGCKFSITQISCASGNRVMQPVSAIVAAPDGRALGPRELFTSFFKIKAAANSGAEHQFGALYPGLVLSDTNFSTSGTVDCSAEPRGDFLLKDKLVMDLAETLPHVSDRDMFPPSTPGSPTSQRSRSQPPSPPPSRASSRVSSVVDLKKAKGGSSGWPNPADDVVSLIVLWSGMGPHGPVSGQHHVINVKVGVPAQLRPIESRTVFTDSLVKFLLLHPATVDHDFSKQRVCLTSATLKLRNSSPIHPCDVLVELLPPAPLQTAQYSNTVVSTSRFMWVRHTKFSLSLAADESKDVELQACMMSSGVYDLTRFRVTVLVKGEVMGVTQPATQCLLTVVAA